MPEAMAIQAAAEAWGVPPDVVEEMPHTYLDEFRAVRTGRIRYISERVAEALKPGEGSDEYVIAKRNYDELKAILDDPTTQDWTKADVLDKAEAARKKMDELAPHPSAEVVTAQLTHLLVEMRVL